MGMRITQGLRGMIGRNGGVPIILPLGSGGGGPVQDVSLRNKGEGGREPNGFGEENECVIVCISRGKSASDMSQYKSVTP